MNTKTLLKSGFNSAFGLVALLFAHYALAQDSFDPLTDPLSNMAIASAPVAVPASAPGATLASVPVSVPIAVTSSVAPAVPASAPVVTPASDPLAVLVSDPVVVPASAPVATLTSIHAPKPVAVHVAVSTPAPAPVSKKKTSPPQTITSGKAVSEHDSPTINAQQSEPPVAVDTKPVDQKAAANIALFRQLDELRSQNAILAESLKNAELRNKLGDVGRGQPMVPGLTQGSIPGNPSSESFGTLPAQVQLVSGTGNKLSALISLPSGGRVTAKVGSNIYGVGLVRSISLNEVVVENKKQILTLPFASDTSDIAMTPGGNH